MKKSHLFLGLLLVGAVAAGISTQTVLNKSVKRQPYTIVWQEIEFDSQGVARILYTETRYVSSNGNWHSVRRFPDGRTAEMFAQVGKGVFALQGKKLEFMSDHSGRTIEITQDGLRNSPDYIRTETVLGHVAIVLKPRNDSSGRFEGFRAPVLGGDFIKTTTYDENGKVRYVSEPVSLTFGEPAASLLNMPTDLPVSYQHFQKLHNPR